MRFLIFIFLALVLDLACGQYHSSSATAGVNFENLMPSNAEGSLSAQSKNRPRQRRMYAMCPPNFQRVGQECFTYPQQHSSWLEAHFFCKDKNAQLAEPEKYTDEKLRKFLMKYDADYGSTDPIWIGATYDYINHVWQWAISEHNSTYNAFSKKYYERNPDMNNQCAVYDPQLKYRWSSRTCVDKHRFICQHKMPKVSEKNRYKVYLRWNATYPNEYANEVVLEVIDHKGKGRYNRRVKAEGSTEEMVIPSRPRSRQNGRRLNRPTSASLPQENDVNYHAVPSDHPNDIQQNIAPTKHPRFPSTTIVSTSLTNNNYNEITAPKEATTVVIDKADRKSRRRTTHDRKLQRQREKELRRLQRKKERQERMRREKEERLQKIRLEREQQRRKIKEEKQKLRIRQQKILVEVESDESVERRLREKQYEYHRQQEFEDLNSQKKTEEKKHLEYQEREDQRQREERKVLDEGKRKEYEEKLKHAESERARQLAEEQERKRLQDEADRRKLEEEEKERQTELKRQLEEEEERLRLDRLEEERIAEEKELERLREEQRKRAEIQRKREEDIARVEAEQRRIELEEARIKAELEEAERLANIQHESEIRKAEEEARAKEEETKRAEEQEERERQEKLKQAKAIEESRKSQNKENLTSSLKNRFASLSPELRKEFLERRKQRKREKQLREKSTNNEA